MALLTKEQKTQFTCDLVESVKAQVIDCIQSGKIPDDWDGIELRQYLADVFKNACLEMAGRRKKNYRNTMINLPW